MQQLFQAFLSFSREIRMLSTPKWTILKYEFAKIMQISMSSSSEPSKMIWIRPDPAPQHFTCLGLTKIFLQNTVVTVLSPQKQHFFQLYYWLGTMVIGIRCFFIQVAVIHISGIEKLVLIFLVIFACYTKTGKGHGKGDGKSLLEREMVRGEDKDA